VSTNKCIWSIDTLVVNQRCRFSEELNVDECHQVEWNDDHGDGIGALKLTLNDLVTFDGLTNGYIENITAVGSGC
jgi:hypothetical protein